MNVRTYNLSFLLSSLLFLVTSGLFGQNFNGQITYKNGSPCTNAKIEIYNNITPDDIFSTTSDTNGNYKIEQSNKQSQTIKYAYVVVDWTSKIMNINIALRASSQVRLALYDISGKETALIINKSFGAGVHQFSFNCSNIRHFLENKIYLVNFAIGNDNRSSKLIQFVTQRIDFYIEESDVNDLSSTNYNNSHYTARISGKDFETHIVRNLTIEKENQDFVIDRNTILPFKCGDKFIEQYNGNDYAPFYIKGINLGAAIPGTSPAEMAPSKELYSKWFKMMANAGYNTIRIYTIHYPRFYEALKEFNEKNQGTPLYLMPGAWLDEEYEKPSDFYTSEVWFVRDINESIEFEKMPLKDYFDERIKEVIDVVHGNANLPERWGWASGKYTADVSPWVIGYIIGREIAPSEVIGTDLANPDISSYSGTRFSIENSTPTEAWATERLDIALNYEQSQYGQQHPMSFSSWPTLDPMTHPTETGDEDITHIDLNQINEDNAPAGYFASYHAYPYFPDFISCDPDYQNYYDNEGSNSYFGYLNHLKEHYDNRPLIIAEFGMPNGWGVVRYTSNGMHQGGANEEEQAKHTIRMMHNIKEAGCGGGMQFAWIDEWFKVTWIYQENVNPHTRLHWHNLYNPEQNFGMVTYIPEEADYSDYHQKSNSMNIESIALDADIEGFYIKLKLKEELKDTDTLWLALDTYDKNKGESILPNKQTTDNRAEFCVRLIKNNANLFVTKAYDMFGIGLEGYPIEGQHFYSTVSNALGWNKVMWRNKQEDDYCAGSEFDASSLKIRDHKKPIRGDAVIIDKKEYTFKLPWAIINFNNPAQMEVMHITDYEPRRGTGKNNKQVEVSDGISVTAILGNSKLTTQRFTWDKWNSDSMPVTKEHVKTSFYIIKESLKEFETYVK
ncbi:hypothetical protein [Carboxylicivirga sp. M1479]|uniref:hypothetical protein n=1 Tax=Carboxylicivirga sp. M1479 TaxID=2594476 RepID=UPI0011775E11|nr:hypothetical protein [Carboxylicivirga sp. M1479]TRX62370.1 hypothetical protein FNN09_19645 [Carboxylicivirga sp. M1479]